MTSLSLYMCDLHQVIILWSLQQLLQWIIAIEDALATYICVSNRPESWGFMEKSVINYSENDTFKHCITHTFIKVFIFSWTWLVRL